MSITRRELRRSVGRTVGDLLLVTATAAGNTTTLTDILNLGTADNSLIGRIGVVTGGTAGNLGRQVRITANTHASGTVTFVPALPQATQTGDQIEFYNERETATGPDTINEAINDAIRDVRGAYRTKVEGDETAWSYDTTAGVEIPEEWNGISGVTAKDWAGLWRPIPWVDITIDTIGRKVFLANRSQWLADGLEVKLIGTTEPSLLTSDTDSTEIDPEYLRLAVSASILQSTAYRRMNSVEARQDAQTFQGRAGSIRPKARRRAPANWIRL